VMALLAAKLYGGRTVFEKHSDPSSYKKKGLRNLIMWAYSKVEAFCIRHADAVIGTGPGLVEQARRVHPDVNAHHIFDIPSSLAEATPAKTAAIRTRWQSQPDEKLILYVGSFAVYQGIDLMFEAMPLTVSRVSGARFVIIGGSPEEIGRRRDWLRQRGIEQAVTFVGRVPPDDLPNYIAAADLLLSPRIAGSNTPLKLLDYFKAGRAILATDNVANRLILDETCSALAPAEAGPFADALVELLNDDAQREQLAATGRRMVEETYNFTEFKRRLNNCYKSLFLTSET